MEGEVRRLNPEIPTVLLGHLMIDNAAYGAERFLAVGKGFTIPILLTVLVLCSLGSCPPPPNLNKSNDLRFYPGSIERVDFSEERRQIL